MAVTRAEKEQELQDLQAAFNAADQAFRDRLTASGKPERALTVEQYLQQIQTGQATGDDIAPRSVKQRARIRRGKQPAPRDHEAERQQDQAEVAELKARGVVFEEYDMPGVKTVNSIATGGGAKTAWFKDSEGNILAISQRISG